MKQSAAILILSLSLGAFGVEGVVPSATPSSTASKAPASPVPSPPVLVASPSPSASSGKVSFIPESYKGEVPSASSLPAAASSAVPSASPAVKLTKDEIKFLVKEFDRAQRNEMRALEHRFTIQRNEQAASQKVRKKEFDDREKEALHKFFLDNRKGVERREYVRSFMDRKKALNAVFKDEKEQMKREQDVRKESLYQDHKTKMAEFKKITDTGVRPPESLWPKPGL